MHRLPNLSLKNVEVHLPPSNRNQILQTSVERNASTVRPFISRKPLQVTPIASIRTSTLDQELSEERLRQISNFNKSDHSGLAKFKEYQTKRYFSTEKPVRPKASVVAERFAAENNGVLIKKTIPSLFDTNAATQTISVGDLHKMIESKSDNYLLIDLREPEMLELESAIPTSHSFPVEVYKGEPEESYEGSKRFENALAMSEKEFQLKYQFGKPKTNQKIIFYSNTGKRSQVVAKYVESELGFTDVTSLLGGSRLYNKHFQSSSTPLERSSSQVEKTAEL